MGKTKIDGWLVLDKSLNITSAQAVGKVKRLLKPKKIGHGGTLDPLASGILPLALGEATKAFQYVVANSKTYRFSIRWGEERTTDDAEGEVTQASDNRPSQA
ncbi:MAG: pseudouridine synthase, partial [Rickettsiales bacterium]